MLNLNIISPQRNASFVENARLKYKVIREGRHQCWTYLTACCLLNLKDFKVELDIDPASHSSSQKQNTTFKVLQSWSRYPTSIKFTQKTQEPNSGYILCTHVYICPDIHMCACICLLNMVFCVHCKNSLSIFNEIFKFTVKEIQQTRPLLMYNRPVSSTCKSAQDL